MQFLTSGQLWQETWEWGQILKSFRTPFVVIFDCFTGSKDDPLKMSLWFTEKLVFETGYFVLSLNENVATVVNMEWRNNYGIFQMVCRLSFTINQERQSVIVKNVTQNQCLCRRLPDWDRCSEVVSQRNRRRHQGHNGAGGRWGD